MKQVTLLIFLCLAFRSNAQNNHNIRLEGVRTECMDTDSLKAFRCSRGFATYRLNSSGKYVLEDSVICNSVKKELTGKWEITQTELIIHHDTNECILKYPANKYGIIWLNNDVFYSTYISKIEAPGENFFTVFKRLK